MLSRTHKLILIALFAALTAIGAFIRIPLGPVPFTLQFLFCAYAGVLLGSKLGLYSQLLYVGIGLVGVPIFTQGGGPGYVFQPTFGYLIGFILCAYIIGKVTENLQEITFVNMLLPVIMGLLVVYLIGVPYLYLISNIYLGQTMTITGALAAGFAPFIIPDIILGIITVLTGMRVIPILDKNGYLAYTRKKKETGKM